MGKFSFIPTEIKDLYVIEAAVFADERGYFMETYNYRDFSEFGLDLNFVQDNQSRSVKGVLRGLHFQRKYPQGKLVRVIWGEVFDVAVDLRYDSKTFGKWEGVYLSSMNRRQLYIPPGFAHGFLVVSDTAEFAYKCTEYYHPEDECGILWNDSAIGIEWPLKGTLPCLSAKDASWEGLEKYISERR
jgi:dTDP-4-dehydrorhamnose 3,5-epimerase